MTSHTKLTIRVAANGWVVEEEDYPTVFESLPRTPLEGLTNDYDAENVAAFVRMLWHLTDRLSMVGTKHDAVRVSITAQAREE